jgi:RNA polymerase sigma factor (sigma-70 family)
MSEETRQTLIARLSNAYDESSWEEFVQIYSPYIWAILQRMNVQKDEIEDLKQIILFNAWKALPDFNYEREKCKFRTWLSLVSRNAVYKYYRQKSKDKEREKAAGEQDIISEPDVEKIAHAEWNRFVAEKAFESIRSDFSSNVLEIFLMSGSKNDEEVADKFNIAKTSVRVYRMRVQKALLKEVHRLNTELEF